jgi:hemolysin-activating ACP:hemolysin acyltransferase
MSEEIHTEYLKEKARRPLAFVVWAAVTGEREEERDTGK